MNAMQQIRFLTIGFLTTVTALMQGCDTGSSASPLAGVWVTEQCAQLTDANDEPISSWAKSEYTFSSDGTIDWRTFSYTNNSCDAGASNVTSPSSVTVTYEDQGSTTLQDGLTGRRVHVQLKDGDTVALDAPSVYAAILQSNRLCTSANFRFEGSSISYNEAGSTEVDYDECLVRGTLP